MPLFDLARRKVDLIKAELGDLPAGVRHLRPCFVVEFDDLLGASGSLGDDQLELRQMAA